MNKDNLKEIAQAIYGKPPGEQNTVQLQLDEQTYNENGRGVVFEILYLITFYGIRILYGDVKITELTKDQFENVKQYVINKGKIKDFKAEIFLIFENDVFGFVMTIATLLVLRKKPRERLFYLTMYITVVVLELVGTYYKCWYWPTTAWGIFDFLPSYNPPSGISFFYFLLDLGTLWVYKKRHQLAWKRMKNIRKIRLQFSN